MADTPSDLEKRLVLQKQGTDPARQPLELYHLSHDLRGPLNSILGFTELLKEGIEGPINETQEADLAAIYQSARNLLALINNVVDLSKLEAGRLNLSIETVDLQRAIDNVLAAGEVSDRPAEIDLVVEITGLLPPVAGDPERVEQMILACLGFLLKVRKTGRISLAAGSSTKTATVRISTDKVIVPPEELPGLFELQVKVDAAGRSELGRGGLGLPLARMLAEMHQGRLWAESQAGETSFYLELPVLS